MFDIISFGSATRDVLIKSERGTSFKPGEKIEVHEMTLATGGGGTNYAVTFARQGLKTACIGVVGQDANGAELLHDLEKEGVDVSMFQKHTDGMTAYSVILVDHNGERTILSYKGEGQHFSDAKIPFEKLQAKWFLLDSLGGHFDIFKDLVEHAVKNNIKIACNPGGKELDHGLEKLKPLLKEIDVFLVNKDECKKLFGDKKPHDFMPKAVISVSDGHNGVVVTDPQGTTYSAGVPDSPVVERTGAGDAFGSGFVSQFIKEGDIIKAIQFGTANASSVVTQFGSKAGILKADYWGPWPLVEVNVDRH